MANTKRPLRVFLCHASDDKRTVMGLYLHLIKLGYDAWLDKEKLMPGQDWRLEISRAVKNSDAVIVCLSSQSVTKEGFVQKEIKLALDAADEKPDGTIFIIPTRLEDCEVPERLSKFQWVDLYSGNGFERLLKALEIRAQSVNVTVSPKNTGSDTIKSLLENLINITSKEEGDKVASKIVYLLNSTRSEEDIHSFVFTSWDYIESVLRVGEAEFGISNPNDLPHEMKLAIVAISAVWEFLFMFFPHEISIAYYSIFTGATPSAKKRLIWLSVGISQALNKEIYEIVQEHI